MWVKMLVGVAVLAGMGSFSGQARASGGDLIWPDEASYILIGVPVASNVTFTAIDLAYAAQSKRTPRGAAIAETACSGAQLVLLTLFGAWLAEYPEHVDDETKGYVIGYYAWTAALTAHGIVTLATDPSRKPRRAAAHGWDVALAPSPQARGGAVTLRGVW
jgi:hypothetical protein